MRKVPPHTSSTCHRPKPGTACARNSPLYALRVVAVHPFRAHLPALSSRSGPPATISPSAAGAEKHLGSSGASRAKLLTCRHVERHEIAAPQPHKMICRTCLRAARTTHTRFLHTSPRLHAAPAQAASPTSPPAATSTSAAQPFSAPLTPKGVAPEKKKLTPLVKSSVAAGTPLKGLNFEKNKQDPVARADDEYPAWLWGILARQEESKEGVGMGDLFCTFFFLAHFKLGRRLVVYAHEWFKVP